MANNKVDYTGVSAQELINKFTNRPEDKGTIEGIMNLLNKASWVAPPLKAVKGVSMLPFLIGGLGKTGRGTKVTGKAHDVINKIIARNKKSIGNILNKITSKTVRLRRTWDTSKDWTEIGMKDYLAKTAKRANIKDIFGPGETAGISGIAGGVGAAYGMENLRNLPFIEKLVEFMMSDPDTEGSSRMDLYYGMSDPRLAKFKRKPFEI
jgi:hypothetical protein